MTRSQLKKALEQFEVWIEKFEDDIDPLHAKAVNEILFELQGVNSEMSKLDKSCAKLTFK